MIYVRISLFELFQRPYAFSVRPGRDRRGGRLRPSVTFRDLLFKSTSSSWRFDGVVD